jgi:hypothetical protein
VTISGFFNRKITAAQEASVRETASNNSHFFNIPALWTHRVGVPAHERDMFARFVSDNCQ